MKNEISNNTARAIIFVKNNIILIKRENKPNSIHKLYYCFPGGHLEENETFEEACIREVEEEIGIKVKINKLLLEQETSEVKAYEKFFLCDYISGNIGTGTGEEFTKRDEKRYGTYEVEVVNIDKIENMNILPENLKQILLKNV